MAIDQLVRQQVSISTALQTRLTAAVNGAWGLLGGLDDAAATEWVTWAVPTVQAAQMVMSANTTAYLAAVVAELTGNPPDLTGTPEDLVTGPRARKGVEPVEVYQRPVIQARSLVAAGMDPAEALRQAGARAVNLAITDVQSAKLYTAQHVLTTAPGVVGYRRVLSGTHSCGLCVVASTRRYRKADLMPRHPGCDCTPLPIVGDHDPGVVLNRGLLEELHANVAATFGADAVDRSAGGDPYRALVRVYDHGEYGPTLARRGDHILRNADASARPDPTITSPGRA